MSDSRTPSKMEKPPSRLTLYCRLVRLDKPIGSLLLLWPTLSALWLASEGLPDILYLVIFFLGTLLMRSAGCAINDYLDRDIDGGVWRTENRVLVSGLVRPEEALWITAILCLLAFLLVLPLNLLTIGLSIAAVFISGVYPLFKRFFPIPQAWLGLAFGFGIPMAYAAVLNTIPLTAWLLLAANVFWTLAYDTEYAIADRDDDLKLGIHTSAITFGQFDIMAIMSCYFLALVLSLSVGWQAGLGRWAVAGWLGALVCAIYHWYLIRHRDQKGCLAAFHHNNWLGFSLFIGIVLDYTLR
ncbi:MAG: 4-hydroxybenzoate octaprenyltransferase [Oxalobacter sp.]